MEDGKPLHNFTYNHFTAGLITENILPSSQSVAAASDSYSNSLQQSHVHQS